MSAAMPLLGTFTLLHGDPEVREQQPYLQPLYGRTAEDDPPSHRPFPPPDSIVEHEPSRSSNSRFTVEAVEQRTGDVHRQPLAPPPAPMEGFNLHNSSNASPSTAFLDAPSAAAQPELSHTEVASEQKKEEEAAAARSPRCVSRTTLSLYPDLSTGIAGPQPVLGGVAIADDVPVRQHSHATSADPPVIDTPAAASPYLFHQSGAPMLSSIVEPAALDTLLRARQLHPTPGPRSGHVLLPCAQRGTLILFGGLGDIAFNDIWEYNTGSGRWSKLECEPSEDDDFDSEAHEEEEEGWEDDDDGDTILPMSVDLDELSTDSTAEQQQAEDDVMQPISASMNRQRRNRSSRAPAQEEEEEETEERRQERGRERARLRNMPPPAYGQAASIYEDERGHACMAVLGGICIGDRCVNGFFSLNLVTLRWRRLETTLQVPGMWGATAQTLYARRRYALSPTALEHLRKTGLKGEEQVVVLFGGMTDMGEVLNPPTHLLHLDHRLTEEEVMGNAEQLLSSLQYHNVESELVRTHVLREEGNAERVRHAPPSDDGQQVAISERCLRWRARHPERLRIWREKALRRMIGKYWVEVLPVVEDLHGRRRPTSATYQRHFMFVFGGRDDYYFYNDLWCLNAETRRWVQIRDGIPSSLLRRFLADPWNATFGDSLAERGVELRRSTVAMAESKLQQMSGESSMATRTRGREIHHALFSSSVNSTARARTGACMVVDADRHCLYIYGGFSYTGQQHLTFFDLHAYYIELNVWRRVSISRCRPWEACLDAAADAVEYIDQTEAVRPYPRHADGATASHHRVCLLRAAVGLPSASTSALLPPTLMGYAAMHLGGRGGVRNTTVDVTAVGGRVDDDASPRPPIVQRGTRGRIPASDLHTRVDCFHLPTFIPEARTMAAMTEDPLFPGRRFFLHGGRSGEEACGDLFELHVKPNRVLDVEHAKTLRAIRQEQQTGAAAAGAGGVQAGPSASLPARPSASSISPVFANLHPSDSSLPPSSSASASSMSKLAPSDANRVRLSSRRQLQRQLIAAALEEREAVEDLPVARRRGTQISLDLPPAARHSLREAGVQWMRNSLAGASRESLMFLELRHGRVTVNLLPHVHYSSRLSIADAVEPNATGERNSVDVPITVKYPQQQQVQDRLAVPPGYDHDKVLGEVEEERAALSLEVLLYDVLLTNPDKASSSANMSTRNNGNVDNAVMGSPCPHNISPDHASAFPVSPATSVSPGTSPSGGAPLMRIVSRAQYASTRTPRSQSTHHLPNRRTITHSPPPSVALGPSGSPSSVRTPSPVALHRTSGGGSGSSAALVPGSQQPLNNEYDYHLLLRSIFHREPYCQVVNPGETRR